MSTLPSGSNGTTAHMLAVAQSAAVARNTVPATPRSASPSLDLAPQRPERVDVQVV